MRRSLFLDKSLLHDPHDRDSWAQLLELVRQHRPTPEQRQLIERALTQFPGDILFIEAALDMALAGGAFKKATHLAQEILRHDAIHVAAQEKLIAAHLAHLRKQVKAGRLDLARKELQLGQAAKQKWVRQTSYPLMACQSLLELLESGDAAANRVEITVPEGSTASQQLELLFLLALEAGRMQIPSQQRLVFTKRLEQHLRKECRKTDFLHLMTLVSRQQAIAGKTALLELLQSLRTALNRFATETYQREEMERLCDLLYRLPLLPVLAAFAKAAQRRWSGLPVWTFYTVYAK
ncbi:MAG: hypothetical protein HQL60_08985, partial [Magnetococcales bacterium]|nr:hypothetical protein [Magnetococcales bacterium]